MGDWYELGLTVEMAFGYAPTETPVWTDVTDHVRSIPTIRRGRQSEYSQYSPGTATLVLDNRERRFDPEHASSPFAGDLVPMVPVRITTTTRDPLLDDTDQVLYSHTNDWLYTDGVSFPVFYGFVQGWPQAIGKGYTDSTVTVTAVDAFRILNQRRLDTSTYRAELTADDPIAYWPLGRSYIDEIGGQELAPFMNTEWQTATMDWIPSDGLTATSTSSLLYPTIVASPPRTIEVVVEFTNISTPAPDYLILAWHSTHRLGVATGLRDNHSV